MRSVASFVLAIMVVLSGETVGNETPASMRIKAGAIFEEFVKSVGEKKYEEAFALLHPGLQKVWPKDSFTNQVASIRGSLGDNWDPEPTEQMSAPIGNYEQASFRLEEKWNSLFTMQVSAVNTGVGFQMNSLVFKVPSEKDEPLPESARLVVSNFVELLREEKYDRTKSLLTDQAKQQTSLQHLTLMRSMVVSNRSDQIELKKQEYRTLAGGVWYDSVLIVPAGDCASYLELFLTRGAKDPLIASFNFKVRAKVEQVLSPW